MNIDIFNKDDYLIFINSYKITECQKKILLNYYKNKNNIYCKTNSNFQILTLFQNIESNIEEKARLKLLLNNFTNYNIVKYIFKKFQNNIQDNEIINIINKNKKSYAPKPICHKWDFAIQLLCSKLHDIEDIIYLDIGCGDARKTKLFYKYLNLSKENTYCTDIQSWGGYSKDKSSLPFQFKLINDNKLNYEDNKFNIVTCILTLHHISDLDLFIKEIYRIIKPGGYLLLIEHSVYTDFDRILINIQHMLYSALFDKRSDYIENPDFIHCYNSYEWDYIMINNNFKPKKNNVLNFGNEYSIKYDNIFYALYKK
jgi:SAM-dependent methyltransferase